MAVSEDIGTWVGTTVVDESGEKVGTVGDILLDDDTAEPEWLAVNTGLFGKRLSLVPLVGATPKGDDLCLIYAKDMVKGAPNVDIDDGLDNLEEGELYSYYGQEHARPALDATAPGQEAISPEVRRRRLRRYGSNQNPTS